MQPRQFVLFSGGLGSCEVALRLWEQGHIPTLVFCDTLSESEDTYAFIEQFVAVTGLPLERKSLGIDLWQLAEREKIVPSSYFGFCSIKLKAEVSQAFFKPYKDTSPLTQVYIGLDWTEIHRYERAKAYWQGFDYRAPLIDDLAWTKDVTKAKLTQLGVPVPRAYQLGLPHNNCLKYGCVKGGLGYWKLLLEKLPESYARAEAAEQRIRDLTGKDTTVLRLRRKDDTRRITLKEYREMLEAESRLSEEEQQDLGGCGCLLSEETLVGLGES